MTFVFLCLLLFPIHSSLPFPNPTTQAPTGKMPFFEMEKYQFGLLKRGPKWTPEVTAETQKLQEGHMANINKMAQLGKLVAAGPMAGKGDLRGIFIFKAASLAEANALAAEDPAIKAGRLVLELMEWQGVKGIGAKLQQETQAGTEPKYTMTQYYLVLLGKGANWSAANTPENQKLQLDHLWFIRRQLDANAFVAAGPFGGSGEWLGNFVIAAKSPAEAQAIAEADPRVKAGQLSVTLHAWWVAKEVWP